MAVHKKTRLNTKMERHFPISRCYIPHRLPCKNLPPDMPCTWKQWSMPNNCPEGPAETLAPGLSQKSKAVPRNGNCDDCAQISAELTMLSPNSF
jgi:hypothetical protein